MMKIEELGLSTRTYNCLKRRKIDTVEQLSRMTDDDLLLIRNFGPRCLAEVREKLVRPEKTNGDAFRDKIRSMTDEELAEYLYRDLVGFVCAMKRERKESCSEYGCKDCILEWLQQPAGGEGNG